MPDQISAATVVRVEIGTQIMQKLVTDRSGVILPLKDHPIEVRMVLDDEVRKMVAPVVVKPPTAAEKKKAAAAAPTPEKKRGTKKKKIQSR